MPSRSQAFHPQEILALELADIVGAEHVLSQEPMAKHTTFEVGGPAALYVAPHGVKQVQDVLSLLHTKGAPYFVLGRGSDLVVSDEGYPGVVVDLSQGLTDVEADHTTITAQAGLALSDLAEMAAVLGLSGLEFSCGIPGTVGGAVFMNAGAYGSCIADVLQSATVITRDGSVKELSCEELAFSYRTSRVRKEAMTVLSATFALEAAESEDIRSTMEDLTRRRQAKQPLEFPSAGSVFKRPPGYFAGKLIGDAGLAGFQIGGIQVSPKHTGFIVNVGGGTATEVAQVVKKVQHEVRRQFGVDLEPEIQFVGAFTDTTLQED